MKDNKWHKGPPPSIGWWPANAIRDDELISWWDGKRWSRSYHKARNSTFINNMFCMYPLRIQNLNLIEWKHRPDSWPERSKT